MRRTPWLQETRKRRFEEADRGWQARRLTQAEAARLLGVCERTFRRCIDRYHEAGPEGLMDKRLEPVSHRRAPVDAGLALTERYRFRHEGWNVKPFHSGYRREGGRRSYPWVKSRLQAAGLVTKAPGKGKHRKRRARSPWPGLMRPQDARCHEGVAGQRWDWVVTLEDATHAHDSLCLVGEEGTASSVRGVREVILSPGLFSSLYTDRGSHYWHTPEVGGKVDKVNRTPFGRAMTQWGIEMIPAYSPEARGRSERAFRPPQARLPQERAVAGLTTLEAANRYLEGVYRPAFNAEFRHEAAEEGSAFVPFLGGSLDDILGERCERTVGHDHCLRFEGLVLHIPADRHRCHYVKAKGRVHRYSEGGLGVFHGPRKRAPYEANGPLKGPDCKAVA